MSEETSTLYNKELEQEAFALLSKVVGLIELIGWDEDGTYTFPDGEVWREYKPNTKLTSTENISTFKGVM